MKRVALSCAVLAMFVACIEWDTALNDCADAGGCREDVTGNDGGVEVDAGGGGGGGVGDAGSKTCPGLLGRSCGVGGAASAYCFERPAHPVNIYDDVFLDDTLLWAVGTAGTIACYDGTNWFYENGRTRTELNGVSGDDQGVTIVGNDGQIRRWSYKARAWTTEPLPSPNGNNPIGDVWRTTQYEVFASGNQPCQKRLDAGYSCTAPTFGPTAINGAPTQNGVDVIAVGGDRVLRWDGGLTPVITALTQASGTLELRAACVLSDGGAFVGGRLRTGTISQAYVAQFLDGGWVESVRSGESITDAACRADGSALMVELGALLSCSSASTCVPVPLLPTDARLTAVKEGPGRVAASATRGKIQLLSSTLTPAAILPDEPILPDLLGAGIAPDGTAYAVGKACVLLQRSSDGGWSSIDMSNLGCSFDELEGIYFQPNGTGWIAGQNGKIWRWDPASAFPVRETTPVFNGDFLAIAGRGAEVWAVGTNNLAVTIGADGGWQAVPTTSGLNFTRLAMRADGGIAAVAGAESTVVEFDRSGVRSQRQIDAGIGEILTTVWVDDTNLIYVWTAANPPSVHTGISFEPASAFSGALPVTPGDPFNAPSVLSVCGANRAVVVSDNGGRVLRALLTPGSISYTELGSPSGVSMYGLACGQTFAVSVGEYGAIVTGPR